MSKNKKGRDQKQNYYYIENHTPSKLFSNLMLNMWYKLTKKKLTYGKENK